MVRSATPGGRLPCLPCAALRFGGWLWRYDLAPAGPSQTQVTLSYDWSAVPGPLRQHIGFPPFPPDHLGNSLAHLAGLVTA